MCFVLTLNIGAFWLNLLADCADQYLNHLVPNVHLIHTYHTYRND